MIILLLSFFTQALNSLTVERHPVTKKLHTDISTIPRKNQEVRKFGLNFVFEAL